MDVLMIILRIIHIFAGIMWVGSTLFMLAFLTPTLQQLGADAGKFMRVFILQTRYTTAIAGAAIATTLAGIWMFFRDSGNFSAAYFSTPQGVVLTIGALFGLFAAGHGLGVMLPISRKLQAAMQGMSTPPSQEQMTTLQGLQDKMARNTRIIAVLMLIAVLGMSTFRYF